MSKKIFSLLKTGAAPTTLAAILAAPAPTNGPAVVESTECCIHNTLDIEKVPE